MKPALPSPRLDPSRGLRPSRVFLALLALLPLLAAARPVLAQQDRPVLTIVVSSTGGRLDGIAVSYTGDIPAEEMRQDLVNLAGELKCTPPKHPKITRGEVFKGSGPISSAEAKFPGLVNWTAGTVNLEPIIQTYRRFGFFRVVWMFLGVNFPMAAQPPSITHEGYRVETIANGALVDQRIWIDQSHGPPARLEPLAGKQKPAWAPMVALGAILLILAVSGYLILHVSRAQKRRGAA